jgi:hypothetical protein
MKTYVHRKTGNRYVSPGEARDCTNSRDGLPVVLYWKEHESGVVFVREKTEFEAKFEELLSQS